MLDHRLESLRNADQVLTISDHTRSEFVALLGAQCPPIQTIWGAATSLALPSARSPRRGVVCAGGDHARKNEISTIRAFADLPSVVRRQHPLTVVGRPASADVQTSLPDEVAALGLSNDEVRVLSRHISDDDLAQLLGSSRLLVMPSLGEGLGLPILEAWELGTPAIASSTTSLGQVVNDPEWVFNPLDIEDQARALHTLLTDDDAYRRCVEFGERRRSLFTWKLVAERAVDFMGESLATNRSPLPDATRTRTSALVVVPEPREHWDGRTREVLDSLQSAYDCQVVDSAPEAGLSAHVEEALDRRLPERVLVLITGLSQAPCVMSTLAQTGPAVVIDCCRPDSLPDGPGADPVLEKAYRFEANGIRSVNPTRSEYLAPLAARCLGVLLFSEASSPRRLGRPLSGRVTGPEVDESLVASVEVLYRTLPPPLPAQMNPSQAAASLARNRRHPQERIFLDVTALKTSPYRSGIQRVTIALARNLSAISDRPIYPVAKSLGYLALDSHVMHEIAPDRADLDDLDDASDRVLPGPGDTLLMTEIYAQTEPWEPLLAGWRARGGKYVQVVYDLLPIRQEDFFVNARGWFEGWLSLVTRHADLLVCDSQDVARDLRAWLDENPPDRLDQPVIDWMRLGYDLNSSASFPELLRTRSRGSRRVLVVGTIEPRKGVEVVLDAAEALHARGEAVEFVFVGRAGWALPSILGRLDELQRSSRPITWIQDATDEELRLQYLTADLLVMASRGEGFGLPIVEALAHGVPVVARDLPVFRELLGDQDCYFRLDGELPELILRRLRSTDPIQYNPDRLVTWRRTTEDLLVAMERRRV